LLSEREDWLGSEGDFWPQPRRYKGMAAWNHMKPVLALLYGSRIVTAGPSLRVWAAP
jgi:hypothetical protein